MRHPILLLLALVLTGCTSITSEQRDALKSASSLYAAVTSDLHRDDLIATLGEPQKTDGATLTWKTAITPRNYEALAVELRPDGTVGKIIRSSHRFARGPAWHGERHIETSK